MRTLLRRSWVVALAAVAVGVGVLNASGAEPYYHDAGAKARGSAASTVRRAYSAPVYREGVRSAVRSEPATPPAVAAAPTPRRSFSHEPGMRITCPETPRGTTAPEATRGARRYSYEPGVPSTTAQFYGTPMRRSFGRTSPGYYSRADSKALGR